MADDREYRDEMIEALGQARRIGCSCVSFADASLPQELGSNVVPYDRMVFLLSGTHTIAHAASGEELLLSLRPGTALFAPPYGWIRHIRKSAYCSLGVVFKPEFTRLLLFRVGAGRRAEPVADAWFHTAGPLAPAARYVVDALVETSGREPTAARHLMQALLELLPGEVARAEARPQGGMHRSYQAALAYLTEHYHRELSRNEVARHLRLHPNYVSRVFAEIGGESFIECVIRLRLECACRLLCETRLTVGEIAARSGFGDTGHFLRLFRRRHGISPGKYRVAGERPSSATT